MPDAQRYAVTFKDRTLAAESLSARLPFAPGRARDACDALRDGKGLAEDDVLSFPELGVLSLTLSDADAARVRSDSAVRQILPVRKVASERITPPAGPEPLPFGRRSARERAEADEPVAWNIQMVKADQVWDRVTGAGVKVGIIDSGIDRSHPDLTVTAGVSFARDRNENPITDWDDVEDGHGTFCAGIAAARRNSLGVIGVAPECSLYAIKVSHQGSSNTDYMLAGMVWAARNRLDVVSLSLWDDSGGTQPHEEPWEDMERGAQLLIDSGCVVVGIAGNSGLASNHWVTNPGRCPGFIAVGGLNHDKVRWVTSSYGPDDLPEKQGVELIAPGMDIRSTYRGGGFRSGQSGTSYACPHVTGAVALLKQLHPSWTPEEIRVRLKQTAQDLGPTGRDSEYGLGLLDCYRAVFDPAPPGAVLKQIIGRVTSVGRSGETTVAVFGTPTRVRNGDWADVTELRLVFGSAASPGDIALLASSVGRDLDILGLFQKDPTEPAVVHAQDVFSIFVK